MICYAVNCYLSMNALFTSTGQYGLSSAINLTYSAAANELTLKKITANAAGNSTFTTMDLPLTGTVTNGAKVKPVLYSDNAGAPDALIATGNETTLASGDTGTTKVLDFAATQTLVAGTAYWIGWISSASFGVRSTSTSGSGSRFKANTYASGAPASAGAMTTTAKTPEHLINVTVAAGLAGFWDTDADPGQDFASAANEVDLIKITTPSTRTANADALVIRLAATVVVGGKFKGVIYSDSGGAPDALLGTGSEVTVAAANTELTSTFSGVTLQPSTDYWIGTHSDNISQYVGKGGTTKYKAGQAYGSGPPANIAALSTAAKVCGFYLKFS